MQETLTLDARRQILEREIVKYSKRGYRVVNRTDTTAQMVKPRQFSCLAATLWTLLFGIGLIFYLFYYLAKKEDVVYLSVDERGRVSRK